MKNEKQTLTPKIRFPEFRDAPGWTTKRLGDLASLVNDRAGDSKCTPYTVNSGVGLVSQQHKFGRTIAGSSLKSYVLIRHNDFAYNKSATKVYPEGFIARYKGHERAAVPNSIFTCFRAQPDEVDPAYLDYLFAGNLHGRWLRKFITVGARVHGSLNVSDADLLSVPVPLPAGEKSAAEQRKIAACLTSLDEWIAAEGRKLEALRAHKKALMQQLFPRQGETRPHLRFPEFRDGREWKRRKIGDLLEKVSFPIEVQADKTYSEIGVRSHGRGIFHKDSVNGAAIGTKRVFRVVEDAFVLNIIFAWEQAVAFTTKAEAGMIASHRFPMFLPKSNACDVRFLKLAFLTPTGKHLLGLASPGGAGRNRTLGQDEFDKIEIVIPDKDEQTKVADILLATDDLIAAQSRKLDGLRAHKKGLMQQLFPPHEDAVV